MIKEGCKRVMSGNAILKIVSSLKPKDCYKRNCNILFISINYLLNVKCSIVNK